MRLFELHRAVQTPVVPDMDNPIGAWKRDPNGAHAVRADGAQTSIEYARPEAVPALMGAWLAELNGCSRPELAELEAIDAYARLHLGFVHIDPS